jgi:hypothetical protein
MLRGVGFRLLKTEKVELLMTNKNAEQTLPAARNLQRAFERAVHDMHQVSLTGQVSRYRTPIFQRAGKNAFVSRADAEKQALSDAAKALAQLWKVSPSSSR